MYNSSICTGYMYLLYKNSKICQLFNQIPFKNWEFTQKSRVPQQTLSLGYPMFHRKVASTKRVSLESGLYQTGFTGKWPLPNCFHWKVAFS